jgi:hypothetical protein
MLVFGELIVNAERREAPYCNMYEIHCKVALDELKSDVKDIKKSIMGNGDSSHSLLVQATLNTNHRIWMESVGRIWIGAVSTISVGSIATILWYVFSHIKQGGV